MEGRKIGIFPMVLEIRWVLQNQLWSNLESTPVCLLVDGAQEFMFLTSASSGSNVVFIKPICGNLYQTMQLVVTMD